MNVRIKKGVRPYGGRTLPMTRAWRYPNGRVAVFVLAPGGRFGWMHRDEREYKPAEVVPLDDEARAAIAAAEQ